MRTKDIIATSIVLGLCLLSIMALATRFLSNKHTKEPHDATHIAGGSNEHHKQLAKISVSWKRMFTPNQSRSSSFWVPTISGLIKAGDEGTFSTTMFAQTHSHPGKLSLQALYEAFADKLRSQPMTERSTYPAELTRFLSSTRRASNGPRRVQSVSHRGTNRRQPDGSVKSQRKSLDLSTVERGLARSMSVKRPILVSARSGFSAADGEQISWMREGQTAESCDGSLGVRLTTQELATLSILLGSPFTTTDEIDLSAADKGVFNISIHVSRDADTRVTLRQHKRSKLHLPANSSGCSTLAAKHLAAGFLPFRQDKKRIHAVQIDNNTLRLLHAGTPIEISMGSGSRQAQWLASLPTSRELSFYATGALDAAQPQPPNPVIDAVSMLPFQGGLVPLAASPLVKTAHFIAAGGLPPARILQRLEGLVDKVNRYAPHLGIFGPLYESQNAVLLYRERERLGKLATTANAADGIADKASRTGRYITLLERLMALIPHIKPQDVQVAVQEATKKELERSYSEAVLAHKTNAIVVVDSYGCPRSDARSKRSSAQSPSRFSRQSDTSTCTVTSLRSSIGTSASNLGKQIEDLLKMELPFSVETVAVVARLVIVAWTLSVEVVAWDEGELGFRVPDPSQLPEKMVLC
jgi:hypothetical protein